MEEQNKKYKYLHIVLSLVDSVGNNIASVGLSVVFFVVSDKIFDGHRFNGRFSFSVVSALNSRDHDKLRLVTDLSPIVADHATNVLTFKVFWKVLKRQFGCVK